MNFIFDSFLQLYCRSYKQGFSCLGDCFCNKFSDFEVVLIAFRFKIFDQFLTFTYLPKIF